MKKNLIIGAATGYKYEPMKYFFTSLKKINFDGDIAILVSDKIDEGTKNNLLAHGVILIYIKSSSISFTKKYAQSRLWKIHGLPHKLLFKLLNTGKNKLSKLSKYVKMFHLISGSRYCYYYDYLLANKKKYKFILTTDVRDVIFQADPFAGLNDDVLHFYEQDDAIRDNSYTSYWLKHGFGKKALAAVENKKSICSGTTIGSFDKMLDYLEKMIIVQAQITAGITGLGGFDQGVHNYMIYNNFFPGSDIIENPTGEVVTLENLDTVTLTDNQELVNQYNKVIPVVHLYDRYPDLKLKALL
jgi:hypothetical protein